MMDKCIFASLGSFVSRHGEICFKKSGGIPQDMGRYVSRNEEVCFKTRGRYISRHGEVCFKK